jgi:putative glycosyltransferase (TIGR04372 family)
MIKKRSEDAIYGRMKGEEMSSYINVLQEFGYNHLALYISTRNRRAADYIRLDLAIAENLSISGRWHLAKQRSFAEPNRFQPLNVEHQFLNSSGYRSFERLARKEADYSIIVFGPQVGISNGHIDYMLPSIYEKVFKEKILGCNSPEINVFVDLKECANIEILGKLNTSGIINIYPYSQFDRMLRGGLANFPHDHVALTNSCIFLNRYRIPNIYSQEKDFDMKITKEIEGCLRTILCKNEYCGKPPKKLLCIHNRDSGYKAQEHMKWRDSDPNILVDSLNICRGLGLKIVRIGQNGMRLKNPSAVAYDKNSDKNQLSDDFILSRTSLFIGTSSGPCHYAHLFVESVLMTNSTTLISSNCPSLNTIIGLRNIEKLRGKTRVEKIKNILGDWGDQSNIEHRELTAGELREDIDNIINKDYKSVKDLIQYPLLKEYPIIHNLHVTERCYRNIAEILEL